MLSVVLVALCIAVGHSDARALDPPPPTWDMQFYVPINQTIRIGERIHNNVFQYYYDAIAKESKSVHGRGQYDEMCRSIRGKEFSDEPCTHLVSSDGWRYLIFDDLCCQCCNVTEYCGIIAPNWLRNGTYQGHKTFEGRDCEGWMKEGGEANYYYQTLETHPRPCVYFEGYPKLTPTSYNLWNYETDQYRAGPVDPSVFTVPPHCDQPCPSKSCNGS